MSGLIPLLLIHLGALPPVVPEGSLVAVAFLGVLMPAVAASALTARASGRHGLRELWRRLLVWRVGPWWAAAVLLQPLLLVGTALLVPVVGAGTVSPATGLTPASIGIQVVFLVLAATGEEVGWRGLALPALQERVGALRASVVLGVVTATWHLPYWLLQGVLEELGWEYLAVDYVFVLALTFQLTWLVNHSHGSVLVAVAFHVVFNTVNVAILPVTATVGAFALLTVVEVAVAVGVVAHLGPVDLRERRRAPLARTS